MTLTIGIDVGGTKIAGGVVDETGEILATKRVPTPASSVADTAAAIAGLVNDLRSEHDGVVAVGVGAAGFVDAAGEKVIFAPNLAWRNEPLAERVSTACGLPVLIENDANAAAWGEYQFGAARHFSSAVVVTVGTGIGGGVIIDNQLIRGHRGFAAELGHICVKAKGRKCGCGERGCWETYASGNALVRSAREAAEEHPQAGAMMIELAGGKPELINGLVVAEAAKAGDELALECFETLAKWLGRGMADVAAVLDPEGFVIAGGVSENGEILRAPAERYFNGFLTARDYRQAPVVVTATLGNAAGMIGAADRARLQFA